MKSFDSGTVKALEFNGHVEYDCAGSIRRETFSAGRDLENDTLSIRFERAASGSGESWLLRLDAKKKLRIKSLRLEIPYRFDRDDRMFLNGYQSWTDSKEFSRDDAMRAPSRLLRPLLKKHNLTQYGDYTMVRYPEAPGMLHGYSYAYLRGPGETFMLVGSLNERTGYTVIRANLRAGGISLEKDCDGVEYSGAHELLSVLWSVGGYAAVFDEYFAALKVEPPKAKPATGWTSWYNYYQNISEEIIIENLEAFSAKKIPFDIFQVDDGYQCAIGDWLCIQDKFPKGMKYIADMVREAGYSPGLWLAPFVCETKSRVFAEHPDWIVRDASGEPLSAGGNWSGFYPLDLESPAVREYLRAVFRTVLDDWGYDIVKLDFLYAACIVPRNGKSRGRLMCEAMDFLREVVGNKKILGCGVPLWPAFGKVEYCRIGADIDLQWDNKLYRAVAHRERPSTLNSVETAIGRRHLDGRAFVNDPDVFLLRRDNIKLTPAEQETLLAVNALFGNLLFTSDNIKLYGEAEMIRFMSIFPHVGKDIRAVACDKGLYKVRYATGKLEYVLYANLGSGTRRFTAVEAGYISRRKIFLPPHESICLLVLGSDVSENQKEGTR